MVTKKLLWIAALAAHMFVPASGLPAAPVQTGSQAPPRPKLVVLLVVDQLRGDYLTDYGGNFTAGLSRLMREGAWFKEAEFPYLNTVTCAGHATIGTGTFPYQHGMILNGWLDRRTGKSPYCTDDPSAKDISYNGLEPGMGDSAKNLLRPTLGEQIHDRGGRSVAMSLKTRSAIPLAGREADAVIWFDARGGWSTSSAYTRRPVPFLQQFIDANPLVAVYEKTWERLLDLTAYKYEDDGVGEGEPAGWTRTFPHPLGTPGGKPDPTYYSRWQLSPYADEYLARMAMAAIDALHLGRESSTDFLGIGFSSLDMVGHAFGPRSHEVQDLLIRLDRTIGRLLDHLDKTVGPDNYVLGLSADHGVADVPEQVGRGGRQPGRQAFDALTKALAAALGPGDHVAAVAYTDIYLEPDTNRRLKRDSKLMATAVDALLALPAVDRVFRADEVATADARASTDPVLRAAALSYHKDRSGDLIIVPKEQWLFSTAVTTHGTNQRYDQHVPVIVFGASIKAGEYAGPATPADLMPTLAAVAGVRIEKTDGRPLSGALAVPASR